MKRLAVLVIATVLATAYAGADASEKGHRKYAVHPPKIAAKTAAKTAKTAPGQPVEKPVTRLPVPVDMFRA
jgi:hypothetical protein